MPPSTATLRPSDLLLEANGLEAQENRTKEQDARLTELKETIERLSREELERMEAPNEQAAEEAAAALAEATAPDRPDGAADDEPALTQEQREAVADFDPEPGNNIGGPAPDAAADEAKIAANEPSDEEKAAALNDPAFRERLKETSGIAADHAEARADAAALKGELDGYVPGKTDPPGVEVEPAGEEVQGELVPRDPIYDVKVWQAIIGGPQPDTRKVAIKSIAGLVLENVPKCGLKTDTEYEIRCTVIATGYGSDLKLKRDKETDEITRDSVEEKRTLTVTDAWIVD